MKWFYPFISPYWGVRILLCCLWKGLFSSLIQTGICTSMGRTLESRWSNVVEERWEQLLRIISLLSGLLQRCSWLLLHAAGRQQLKADLCLTCKQPSSSFRETLLSRSEAVWTQLDRVGRTELNLQASAVNAKGTNHLRQPRAHTQMGLSRWRFPSLSSQAAAESNSERLPHAYCGRYNKWQTRHHLYCK